MSRIKVLLDTDIGSDIDDAICLSYVLGQPACELLGVTTVSGQPRMRAALADAVCRAAGRTDVPVHAGTEHALVTATPQPEVPQARVLDRFDHRPAEDFAPNTAIDFLRDTILGAPGDVTLLSVGPMTNVGLLFATYPEAAEKLGALMVMGGAYPTTWWVSGGREWNVSCDPTAARIVYRTPVARHRSVGLNVTTRCVRSTLESIERFAALGGSYRVVAAMAEVWGEEVERVVYHDPLAAASIVRPELCRWQPGRVRVEVASRRHRGTTSFESGSAASDDPAGAPHEVAIEVDVDGFFAELFTPT